MHEGKCLPSSSNKSKSSFSICECGRIHRYAVVHLQHGHKIESLGAISNFEQFCAYNTNNLTENPRPESLTLALISVQLEVSSRSTQLKNIVLCRKNCPSAFFSHGCVFDRHKIFFRSSLSNQQIRFDCSQFQRDIMQFFSFLS